jgi:Sporulation and spore germination/Immunoglobulin-like domain of bacterial spore germination
MKHFFIYFGAFIIVVALAIFNWGMISGKNIWLVQNSGFNVPDNSLSSCTQNPPVGGVQVGTTSAQTSPVADDVAAEIKIDSPAANDVVSSPLQISGQAKGSWYFEAVFPVKLIDENGQVIAQGQAQAQSDWTSPDFVPFTATLNFSATPSAIGMLVFSNDNPSGLPQNEKEFGVPVRFSAAEQLPVKVYFNNTDLSNGATDCSLVYPVERLITKTSATARAALEQLLQGTTRQEKTQGYSTAIDPGLSLNSLTIDNGTAKVDFGSQLLGELGDSCHVSAIRAEIIQTLEQFPTITNVIISINGNTNQPLQQ